MNIALQVYIHIEQHLPKNDQKRIMYKSSCVVVVVVF